MQYFSKLAVVASLASVALAAPQAVYGQPPPKYGAPSSSSSTPVGPVNSDPPKYGHGTYSPPLVPMSDAPTDPVASSVPLGCYGKDCEAPSSAPVSPESSSAAVPGCYGDSCKSSSAAAVPGCYGGHCAPSSSLAAPNHEETTTRTKTEHSTSTIFSTVTVYASSAPPGYPMSSAAAVNSYPAPVSEAGGHVVTVQSTTTRTTTITVQPAGSAPAGYQSVPPAAGSGSPPVGAQHSGAVGGGAACGPPVTVTSTETERITVTYTPPAVSSAAPVESSVPAAYPSASYPSASYSAGASSAGPVSSMPAGYPQSSAAPVASDGYPAPAASSKAAAFSSPAGGFTYAPPPAQYTRI